MILQTAFCTLHVYLLFNASFQEKNEEGGCRKCKESVKVFGIGILGKIQ